MRKSSLRFRALLPHLGEVLTVVLVATALFASLSASAATGIVTQYLGQTGSGSVDTAFATATATHVKQVVDFDGDGFDGLAPHTFTPIPPDHYAAQGVTIIGLDARSVDSQPWSHSPPIGAWQTGFSSPPGQYSFVFADPVASFGLFANDVDAPVAVTVHLLTGTESFTIPAQSGGASVTRFHGFVADSNTITRIDFLSSDYHIIDDVQFGRVHQPICASSDPGNAIVQAFPPADLSVDQTEGDSGICLFAEKPPTLLGQDLRPKAPSTTNVNSASVPTRLIQAGSAIVGSYLLHADRVGSPSSGVVLSGQWTFDEPILGIAITPEGLNFSDSITGFEDPNQQPNPLSYEKHDPGRGLEGSAPDYVDVVRVDAHDPNTLHVTFGFNDMDEIRVFTGHFITPPGLCASPDPGNAIVQTFPPADLSVNHTEGDTGICLFKEQSVEHLSQDLQPKAPSTTNVNSSSVPTRLIPAGSEVTSYLLHADRVGSPSSGVVLSGQWTFDEPILGIAITRAGLNFSDSASITGLDDPSLLHYEKSDPGRGLETAPNYVDVVRVDASDPNTLHVTFGFNDMDEIRVFTGHIDIPPGAATIHARLQTTPDGSSQEVAFTGALSGSLSDNGELSASVAPGNYSVQAATIPGWGFDSLTCDDADSTGSAGTGAASLVVAAGESVTCTWSASGRPTDLTLVNAVLGMTNQAMLPIFTCDPSGGPSGSMTWAETNVFIGDGWGYGQINGSTGFTLPLLNPGAYDEATGKPPTGALGPGAIGQLTLSFNGTGGSATVTGTPLSGTVACADWANADLSNWTRGSLAETRPGMSGYYRQAILRFSYDAVITPAVGLSVRETGTLDCSADTGHYNETSRGLSGSFCTPTGVHRVTLSLPPNSAGEARGFVASPGQSVSTDDGEGDGATPADPFEVALTTPQGGAVTLLTSPTSVGTASARFGLFGWTALITAPDATAGNPLAITFRLDSSLVAPGQTQFTARLYRNGVRVPDCASGATSWPAACIDGRAKLADGDIVLSVRTPAASTWDVGFDQLLAPAAPQASVTAGSASLTVNWTPPTDDGGSPITGYRLTTAESGNVVTVGPSASTASFTGLASGKSYTILVQGVNAIGAGRAAIVTGSPASYQFQGFLQPVDNPPTVNNANAGQTIPVKWRITDSNGLPVSDPRSFVSATSASTGCSAGSPTDDIETYSGSSGLQYLGNGNWQFNWKTVKSYAGQCRTLRLNLADGVTTHVALIKFK